VRSVQVEYHSLKICKTLALNNFTVNVRLFSSLLLRRS